MSRLNYLDDCPGFENRKSDSNAAAEEGEELHAICQKVVETWANDCSLDFDQVIVDILGQNKHLNPEQAESVRVALAPIKKPLTNWATEVYTEEKLEIFNADGSLLSAGFADVVLIGMRGVLKWAEVFDWKFGRKVVRDGQTNLQGMGYGYGVLQKIPDVSGFNSWFIQPRVQDPTCGNFGRVDMPDLYQKIATTIERAKDPNSARRVNDNCVYCAHSGTCGALVNYNKEIATSYNQLPAIKTFHGSEIVDPAQMALALYAVKRAEPAIESVKKAAVAMARDGQHLAAVWGDSPIEFELKERQASATLGEAPLVYDALKDVLDYELFIGCVDVRYTDLQERYAQARVEQAIARGEKLPTGKKFTKIAALVELQKRLEGEGLISRSDTPTHYLKEIKHKPSE